jgi:hypothetical protein
MLDCGATVNLIPEEIVMEIGLVKNVRPPESLLRMHDDTPLKTVGMITLPVEHLKNSTKHYLDFYVTANNDKPILGAKTCLELNLMRPIYENICTVQPGCTSCITEKEIFDEYADLFEGVGRFEGTVHFDVDESVRPVQLPLRRLAIGVRDKVGAELKRLEQNGIIAPVNQPTKWVSAYLAVVKADGKSVRICLDPKPLNKALIRTPYCSNVIEDVLPKLSKVKVLSSVDCKEEFFHSVLDTESSMLTCMDTP